MCSTKNTILLCIDRDNPDVKQLGLAASILKKGGLVVFPTETVYGLGANALDREAAKKIYAAKGRPSDNPLIVHIASFEQLGEVAAQIPAVARELADRFWPGPLTFVLPKKDRVPSEVTGGLDTVAVRQPAHPVALALIKKSELPLAAPSANLSGKVSPTSADHVVCDLWGRVDLIIDSGRTGVGLESTVLDLTVWPPLVLRPGGISLEQLRETVPEVDLDPAILAKQGKNEKFVPRAPGLKYTHYSPEANLILVRKGEKQKEKMLERLDYYLKQGKRVGVLCQKELSNCFCSADLVLELMNEDNLDLAAHNLFSLLRRFDQEKIEFIIAEGVSSDGIGLAVMNRLTKAAEEIY